MNKTPAHSTAEPVKFIPGSVTIRLARRSDALAIAKVQFESYSTAYKSLFPEEYLAGFTLEEQEQDWIHWLAEKPEEPVLVAETDERGIIGYSLSRILVEEPGSGEVAALHVLPSFKGLGVGKRLFIRTARMLEQMGCTRLVIWTLAGNPAQGFYERMGGQLAGEKALEIEELNFSTSEVCYAWDSITVLRGNR